MLGRILSMLQGGTGNVAEVLAGKHIVIDVRTPQEFAGGHVAGSKNIPLQQLQGRMNEIPSDVPIVFCCASGARSGSATSAAQAAGRTAINGGPWVNVNRLLAGSRS